ncbi:MAG: nicotinate-nucleotide adenylyltransferase [Alphaproteobacteria bacterium]|nr:nicotinate-nucleotide adenylyltransferase [Alphaproteobacteria bacterium]
MIRPHPRNGSAFAGLTIGLLGGSFNPAHEGHRDMSLYALKRLGLDQIWWLVSPQNPLKPTRGMAPFADRLAHASRIAHHPRLIVTDIEAQLGTRYTADTLRLLARKFPHTRFIWLMGADNLRQIPHWQNWRAIFASVPIAVFRRPAYPAGRGLGKAAIRFGKGWTPPSQARLLARKPLPAWVILDNKLNPISATKLRKEDPEWQA